MLSSISRSSARVPMLSIGLLAVAMSVWIASAAYTLAINPEIALYKRVAEIKRDWARRMASEHGQKTVIYGGSSCSFSVDAQRMLARASLPVVNMGLHAGMGPLVLTRYALSEVKEGDTLVAALEPFLLTDSRDPRTFDIGVQFCFAMREPEWCEAPYAERPSLFSSNHWLALR